MRLRFLVALGLVGALGVAACSGSASSPPAPGSPGPSPGSPGSSAVQAPNVSPANPRPAEPAPASWTTYQHDRARHGLVADRLGAPVRRLWSSPRLDGAVYAQPLLFGDAVIVATEQDSLYRLDAITGAIRWRINFGRPVPLRELPCGNIDPTGITGTPVVDLASGLVWAAPFVEPRRHDLVAVDLATGVLRSRRIIDPPGADPTVQLQRAALTLANGRVYVSFGGLFGDCGLYHGWVVGAPATPGSEGVPLLVWQVPTGRGGGIWAPPGPTVDSAGVLYVATGNSFSVNRYDQGNSVVALSAQLTVQATFAPVDWAQLNAGDTDVGSIGPTLLGDGLVWQAGKAGVGYLLSAPKLGGVDSALFQAPVCPDGGAYGGTAWSPPLIFVPCADGLVAVAVSGRTFSIAWRGPRERVGAPVVTADGVWVLAIDSGQLVQLDPSRGTVRARLAVGQVPHFAAPAVGGGRLVAPSGHGVVAFGG